MYLDPGRVRHCHSPRGARRCFNHCAWVEQRRTWQHSHQNPPSVYTSRHEDDSWQNGQELKLLFLRTKLVVAPTSSMSAFEPAPCTATPADGTLSERRATAPTFAPHASSKKQIGAV